MPDPVKALATQIENIQKRSGKTLAQLEKIIRSSGLTKHGEIRDMLKEKLGMGHGDANTLVHHVLKSDGGSAAAAANLSSGDVVTALYDGPKATLRPIHDRLMGEITKFGAFEVAPKKGYVSLRRKKQFAMIGPATKTQVEVGINAKGLKPNARLIENPPNSMSPYRVRLAEPKEVDPALIAWIRQAYEAAG
jgi:Domain of unknown function (DUF5655)/Domain of unknown function (DUF4287)